MTFLTVSLYITMALSIDRCIAVTMPLRWHILVTRKRVKTLFASVILLSILITLPFNIKFESLHLQDWFNQYFFIVFHIAAPIMVLLISSFILIAFIVVWKMKKVGSSQRQQKNGQMKTNKVTFQVISISLLSLISRCSYAANSVGLNNYLIENFYTRNSTRVIEYIREYYEYNHFQMVFWIAMLLNCINSTVNFFFYCLFNSCFRHEFVQFFFQRCYKTYTLPTTSRSTVSTTPASKISMQQQGHDIKMTQPTSSEPSHTLIETIDS